jgi:hypothetical protein
VPAYNEVIVTVPRQSGKTTLFLSWQIHRATAKRWRHPQRSVFTAQSGSDARKKWLDELYPLIKASPRVVRLVAPGVAGRPKMTEGLGNEHIEWKTGSLIRLLSTAAAAGHSLTLHQAVMDEIWHDQDDRREQGLRPPMITVADKQLLVCSTAGTSLSVVYNRKVMLGRKAVQEDTGRGIAYFEYSAPAEWDPEDEDGYFGFMPALCPDPPCRCGHDDGGWRHSITLDALRSERVSMEPAEYARAYGNVPTPSTTEQPVNPVAFAMLAARRPTPPRERMFFLDVQGTKAASIGTAYLDGDRPFAELAYDKAGTDWVLGICRRLNEKHPGAVWALEKAGAASVFIGALNEMGIEPVEFTGVDMGRACVHLQNLVDDGGMGYNAEDADKLLNALNGAVARDRVQGLWIWNYQKSTTNISPIVAVTGALWLLETAPPMPAIY